MTQATPQAKGSPGTDLAKRITTSLQAASPRVKLADEFAERLATGKVSAEDWRRLAEQSLEEESRQAKESGNV